MVVSKPLLAQRCRYTRPTPAPPWRASHALLPAGTVSRADGNFTITNGVNCTTPQRLVYLVVTGVNPGLTGANASNPNLALMTLLGTCGSFGGSTFIQINELTTVVGVQAIAPCMLDAADIGGDASNFNGLACAFATANAIVNSSTGQLRPSTSGVSPPVQLLDTLANILAACVNTSGGMASDTTNCGNLFAYASSTGATADTITAMLHIVQKPMQNVAGLFGLSSSTSPFQPALTTAPKDFIPITSVQIGDGTQGYTADHIAIDTSQNVWVLTSSNGTITEFDNNLSLVRSLIVAPNDNTGNVAGSIAADTLGDIWVGNTFYVVRVLPSGAPTVYTLPTNIGQLNSRYITIDSANNAWVVGLRTTDGASCLVEYASVPPVGGPPVYCPTNATQANAIPLAVGSGFVDLIYTSPAVFYQVNQAGVFQAPVTGVAPPISNIGDAITFDPKYSHIWAQSSGSFTGNAVAAFNTDGSLDSGTRRVSNSDISYPTDQFAIDGSGNLWLANVQGGLVEIDHTGGLITPSNPAASAYGYFLIAGGGLGPLDIDVYGNIFVEYIGSPTTLYKLPGLAAAKGSN